MNEYCNPFFVIIGREGLFFCHACGVKVRGTFIPFYVEQIPESIPFHFGEGSR